MFLAVVVVPLMLLVGDGTRLWYVRTRLAQAADAACTDVSWSVGDRLTWQRLRDDRYLANWYLVGRAQNTFYQMLAERTAVKYVTVIVAQPGLGQCTGRVSGASAGAADDDPESGGDRPSQHLRQDALCQSMTSDFSPGQSDVTGASEAHTLLRGGAMTRTLAGAMWALLVRMALTVIVGRLLAEALVEYYAGITRRVRAVAVVGSRQGRAGAHWGRTLDHDRLTGRYSMEIDQAASRRITGG